MRNYFSLIIALCIACHSFSAVAVPSKSNELVVRIPDKINLTSPSNNEIQLKDWFPAFITLLVGVGTIIVNNHISKKLRNSASENIDKQLKESKDLKLIDIKASINIKNRQEWMNQYRDNLSEYMAIVTTGFFESTGEEGDGKKLFFLVYKLDLLLHPDRLDEKEAIELYKSLAANLVLYHFNKENKVEFLKSLQLDLAKLIEVSRKILDRNWRIMNDIGLTNEL